MSASIRIAGIVKQSIVDGPGLRFVVFTQGCPHNCEGCHNPETHQLGGGYDCDIEKIISEFDKNPLLKGITFSGGEPFLQADGLIPLAKAVKERGRDVFCYTGYTYEELVLLAKSRPDIQELLEVTDVLVDGRFEMSKKDLTQRFTGSRNQRIIDCKKSIEQGNAVLADLPE